ncbi:colicin E3/pyocin S6 family cytotoxin [Nocardia sp. NBC_01329]
MPLSLVSRPSPYNKRGKHLGEYDPKAGQQTKPAARREQWHREVLHHHV